MKILLTLLLLNFISSSLSAQQNYTANEIIKNCIDAVSKIEKGSYKIDFRMKYFDRKDTINLSALCYFEKDQKIKFGAKLNIRQIVGISHIYNGKEIYYLTDFDSTALIINPKKYGYGFIEGNPVNDLLYRPLINNSMINMLNNNNIASIDINEETIINERICLELVINYKVKNHSAADKITYFIAKENYLPVKKITFFHYNDQKQYQEFTLSEIIINSLPISGTELFEKSSIPSYFKQKNYTDPPKSSKADLSLSPGISAPDFELTSLKSDKIKLSSLQGKLVLLDFSYQACYGCKLALPELQKLHEKYNKQGLNILGINPVDSNLTDYKEYLNKQKISFPFLMASKEIAKQYKVQIFPTLYLIDPNGKIILSDIGYSAKQFAKLEKQIQKQLKILNKNLN